MLGHKNIIPEKLVKVRRSETRKHAPDREIMAGSSTVKACQTQSMPALPRLAFDQNFFFPGVKQFKNRKFPFQLCEKRREYLCVFPSIFMKRERKFSFLNRVFSYLSAPKGALFCYSFCSLARELFLYSLSPVTSFISSSSFGSFNSCLSLP